MSEPKAYRIIQGDTGGCGAPSYKCDTNANRIEEWSDACEVYDKFEADKVIAHNKYKRCLAMAKWCKLEQERIELIECQDITDDDFNKLVKGFYKKWHKRWLELAEKFNDKEAK